MRQHCILDAVAAAHLCAGQAQSYHYNALGMLDSTANPGSVAHAFQYDATGRLIHRATGTGVSESRAYDDDDRLVTRTNNIYNDGYGYDARGKVTSFSTTITGGRITSYSSESSSMHYDGFGGLVEANQNRGTPVADEYALDALGNLVQHDQNRNANFAGRATDSLEYDGPHLTSTASDPLSALRNGGGPLVTTLTTTLPVYDPSGNQIASNTYTQTYASTSFGADFFNNAATGESFVRSYYDAAERLRVSERMYFFTDPTSNPRARTALQEYVYDALGRRVAMRSQRDSTCTDTGDPTPGWDCAQTMERFAWDGDQLLAELRDYGWWGEDPGTLNGYGLSTGNFYGTTRYIYALTLFGPDTPLMVNPASGGAAVLGVSWRGTVEGGTNEDGSNATGYNWPGQQTGLYLAPDLRNTTRIVANKWYGSIADGKADPSGLVYDRNRYYDPSAGRFTQEDPIGLSGGLNLYGYAGADPANNADPFGLWPAWMEKIGAAVTSYVRAQVDELKQPCDFSCGMRMATSMTLGMTGGVGEVGEAAGAGGLRAEFNNVVRPQFWKSEATGNAEAYSSADLARMANGKPPIGSDGFPMELHHDVPLKDGGTNDASNLKPMTRTDHRLGANYKVNHPDQPPEDYYF